MPSGGSVDRIGSYVSGSTCDVIDTVRVTDALAATDTAQVTVRPCPGGAGGAGGAGGSGTGGGSGPGGASGADPLDLKVGCGCGTAPSGLWLALLLLWRRRR
jgi:hypothetical protein